MRVRVYGAALVLPRSGELAPASACWPITAWPGAPGMALLKQPCSGAGCLPSDVTAAMQPHVLMPASVHA